jgi:Flp pilus assembly protein TadD
LLSLARGQTACWRNSSSLWSQSLAHTHGNFVAHSNLGTILFAEGNTPASIEQFKKSLQIGPRRSEVWNNLAVAYAEEEQWVDAVAAAQCAIALAEAQGLSELAEAIHLRLKEYRSHGQETD